MASRAEVLAPSESRIRMPVAYSQRSRGLAIRK
jgi:hypothetical protein